MFYGQVKLWERMRKHKPAKVNVKGKHPLISNDKNPNDTE